MVATIYGIGENMNRNQEKIQIVIFSALICGILMASGCTETLKSNTTKPQTQITESFMTIPTIQESTVSLSETQTKIVTIPISVKVTDTPHFTRTISYGPDRSSALTEDQAWKYAEVFLEMHGIQNIQSSEVRPIGQFMWTFENKSQTMTWGFEVNRMQSRANIGGTITIDAYDGRVIHMGWFD